MVERREAALAGATARAPIARERARRSGRPAGGGCSRRRRASSARPRAGRRASPAAAAAACRRCRRRSSAPGAAPRRPGPWITSSPSPRSSTRAPSAATAAQRGARVGRVEVVRDAHGRRAHRPEQRGAVRDRLVRRRRERAAQRRAGAEGRVHARATGSPSSASERLGLRGALAARDPQRRCTRTSGRAPATAPCRRC